MAIDLTHCQTPGRDDDICDMDDYMVGVIPLACSVLALIMAYFLTQRVMSHPRGNAKMNEISDMVQAGAKAFLKEEYKYLSIFVLVVSVALLIIFSLEPYSASDDVTDGARSFGCFVAGALLSALAGWFGMIIATAANVRTASAADTTGSSGSDDIPRGLNAALKIAFAGGAVMGFAVVGLGLLGISLFYIIMLQGRDDDEDDPESLALESLSSFGFGASSIALFARVAGGIYTKAADVGADLVGKVEQGIPEDDPRNPATIADNVGDNVGDVAGMGADLFESFVGSIIACATLGDTDRVLIALPFFIAGAGIVASLIGFNFVGTKEGASQTELLHALHKGTIVASVFSVGFSAAIIFVMMGERIEDAARVLGCVIIGLISGIGIGQFTEYFTSYSFKPTQSISDAGVTGPATVLIQGLGIGMLSCMPPTLLLAIVIFACDALAGAYGVAIAAVGMLSTLGVTLATDAYGPVADNAGGIAEMAELPESVRDTTDALDALGNTTAATGKGFAIGSAVLTALSLMAAFTEKAGLNSTGSDEQDPPVLSDPTVLAGALLGAMLPLLFAALTMLSVQKAAGAIIMVVRRQFKEKPGIMDGSDSPDHEECVRISTMSSIEEMVLPGAIAVLAPLIVGFLVGPRCLLGVLGGTIVTGAEMAIMMSNAGGAWDNAKKFIEIEKAHGGKGTDIHKAVVVGDTVGDPFKDTSGPALNILIKLMSMVSLTIAPLIKGNDDYDNFYIGFAPLVILVVVVGLVWKYIVMSDKYNYQNVGAADKSQV